MEEESMSQQDTEMNSDNETPHISESEAKSEAMRLLSFIFSKKLHKVIEDALQEHLENEKKTHYKYHHPRTYKLANHHRSLANKRSCKIKQKRFYYFFFW